MKMYVRESRKLSSGRTLITHYTAEEYFWQSTLKIILFLLFIWPAEILFWTFFFFFKYAFILMWLMTKWTFIGLGKGLSALFRRIFHHRQ
ncbi:MAG: hypothetical protein IKG82_00835 [Oscillospiraceae bacterium]|nr:hypothetical protein [Oscillospiraceae bacterium]